MTNAILNALIQQANQAADAAQLVRELLWFDDDWHFIRDEHERAFLEDILDTSRAPTQSEWEWLRTIEVRYVECREQEPWRG